MMHMLSLLPELLKRIPTGYRQWTLLRVTCHKMDSLLGDYHDYYGVCFRDECMNNISYGMFLHGVTNTIRWRDHSDYDMTTKHIPYTDMGPYGYVCTLRKRDITIYKNNKKVYRLDSMYDITQRVKAVGAPVPVFTEYITIYDKKYIPVVLTGERTKAVYEWMYNELPRIFSNMTITRQISPRDVD